MSYLKERVAYLKGLAEGLQISDSSNEGKLLKAIIDVLDDVAMSVEDIEEIQDQLSEQVDSIDEDLGEVEKILYDEDECDCDCDCDDDDDESIMFKEVDCPHCGEKIDIDADMIDEEGETLQCPHCHKDIEIEWDCGCGCGCEDDEDDSEK